MRISSSCLEVFLGTLVPSEPIYETRTPFGSSVSARVLFPQLTDGRFVHASPVVELCRGLLTEALDHGVERLEVLAPREGSAIAEIRAYRGECGSRYFELPSSMHHTVVRRFKAMARMRRTRPADAEGFIRLERGRGKPIQIRVTTNARAEGQVDVIMTFLRER